MSTPNTRKPTRKGAGQRPDDNRHLPFTNYHLPFTAPPRPMAVVRRRTRHEREVSAWLAQINPLRDLTVEKAQQIFDAARRGNDVRLQWVYANMEEADPTLLICAERRGSALVDLDWTIRPKAAARAKGFDQALADEQTAFLEQAYGQAEDVNLFPAIEHLASAFFRGHAHAQPRWTPDGLGLAGFDLLDAWNLCRDLLTDRWHWNPSASETLDFASLQAIPPRELVTLVRPRHIDYPAMAIYLRNGLGEREWGRFLERYGIPPVIITMPDTIDPSQVDAFCARAVDLNNGASGALPSGSTVTYAQEARGVNPFKEFLEHQQQLVVLMATGGMLTSLTGATGIGQGASGAHEETWRTIVRRDAALIATALNRTVTDPLLDRAFPGRPHLAAFDFETDPSPTPAEIFDIAAKAVAAGYRVTKEELEERTGYRLEASSEGAPRPLDPSGAWYAPPQRMGFAMNKGHSPALLPPAGPVAARLRAEPTAALQSLAKALQLDLTPAADALQALLKDPSPQAAQALIDRLPQLLPQDPETAAILEEELTKTFADTLAAEPAPPEPSRPVAPRLRDAPTVANSAHEPIRGGNPDNRGQFSKTPGAGQREGETKSHRDEHGTHDEAKLAADPRANRARAKSVITHLLAKKGGTEPKALYRKDTGWIGIDYGEPGNPNNAYKGGHGLAHILAKHPEAKESLLQTLLKGEAYKHHESKRKLYLVHGNAMVVVAKHRSGRLLITDFYEEDPKKMAQRLSKGKYHTKGEN